MNDSQIMPTLRPSSAEGAERLLDECSHASWAARYRPLAFRQFGQGARCTTRVLASADDHDISRQQRLRDEEGLEMIEIAGADREIQRPVAQSGQSAGIQAVDAPQTD